MPAIVVDSDTFPARLKRAIGGTYVPAMRRAVQVVVLFEANRCLKDRYSVLRPFQRKIALYDTAVDIINTLTYIPVYHRISIMFRTASGKVPLTPDLAWRRMKVIEREIKKAIISKIAPLLEENTSHDELCEEFIQSQYIASMNDGVEETPRPQGWEYTHIIPLLAYKMNYIADKINPDLPMARDPNPHRVVPNKKPDVYPPKLGAVDHLAKLCAKGSGLVKEETVDDDSVEESDDASPETHSSKRSELRPLSPNTRAAAERREMLKEVREHLILLKDFEGVISEMELKKRKKELFKSLPPAPSVALKGLKGGSKSDANGRGYVTSGSKAPKRLRKEIINDEDDADYDESD